MTIKYVDKGTGDHESSPCLFIMDTQVDAQQIIRKFGVGVRSFTTAQLLPHFTPFEAYISAGNKFNLFLVFY